MNPDEKKMLADALALVEDNNKILKGLRRSQRWATFTRLVYWGIIIAVAVGSYYFIQPYVDQVQQFMKDSGQAIDSFKNIFPKGNQPS